MTIFTAMYMSGCNYPNEWEFLGNFSCKEKAEDRIQSRIETDKRMYPGFPARYEQRRYCYDIIENELDSAI